MDLHYPGPQDQIQVATLVAMVAMLVVTPVTVLDMVVMVDMPVDILVDMEEVMVVTEAIRLHHLHLLLHHTDMVMELTHHHHHHTEVAHLDMVIYFKYVAKSVELAQRVRSGRRADGPKIIGPWGEKWGPNNMF